MYRAVCLFTPQLSLVLTAPTHGWVGQAELTWIAGYILRWFTRPQTVTHPSTNGAQRRVTSLITTNMLTTTLCRYPVRVPVSISVTRVPVRHLCTRLALNTRLDFFKIVKSAKAVFAYRHAGVSVKEPNSAGVTSSTVWTSSRKLRILSIKKTTLD